MAGRHSPEFRKGMTTFYRANRGASLEQARKYAKKLGYEEYSKAAHDRYRKEAGGKTQRVQAQKASAGELEAPERCWMDLTTGKFFTDFALGKPGTKVAIFDLCGHGQHKSSLSSGKERLRKAPIGRKVGSLIHKSGGTDVAKKCASGGHALLAQADDAEGKATVNPDPLPRQAGG